MKCPTPNHQQASKAPDNCNDNADTNSALVICFPCYRAWQSLSPTTCSPLAKPSPNHLHTQMCSWFALGVTKSTLRAAPTPQVRTICSGSDEKKMVRTISSGSPLVKPKVRTISCSPMVKPNQNQYRSRQDNVEAHDVLVPLAPLFVEPGSAQHMQYYNMQYNSMLSHTRTVTCKGANTTRGRRPSKCSRRHCQTPATSWQLRPR
jgi:hypothetical protein